MLAQLAEVLVEVPDLVAMRLGRHLLDLPLLVLLHLLVVPLAIRLSLILVILLLLIGELLPLVAGGRDKAGGGNPLQDGIGIGALQGGGVLLGEA